MPLFNDIPAQFEARTDGAGQIISFAPDNASAVGTVIDTTTAYSTAGAKLLSVRNAGFEISSIDKYGNAVFGEIYVGYGPFHYDTYPTWLVGTTYALGDEVVYQYRHYRSLQNANTGHTPPAVADAWWQYFPLSNTIVGANSFKANSTGVSNTVLGSDVMPVSGACSQNVAFGHQALKSLGPIVAAADIIHNIYYKIVTVGTTDWTAAGATSNTIGENFGSTVDGTTGDGTVQALVDNNIAIGYQALMSQIGAGSDMSLTPGGGNIAIGTQAASKLINQQSHDGIIVIGHQAMLNHTGVSGGDDMTIVGYRSLMQAETSTYGHTTLGYHTLREHVSGANNVAIGKEALSTHVRGTRNTAVGTQAAYILGSPQSPGVFIAGRTYYITFLGDTNWAEVGATGTLGEIFTATGPAAAYSTGLAAEQTNYNTALGSDALGSAYGGNYNTAIGYQTYYNTSDTFDNTTVLGANATPTKSNQVVLGDTNVIEMLTYGDIKTMRGAYFAQGLPVAPITAPTFVSQSNGGLVPDGDYVYRVQYNWITDQGQESVTAMGPISAPMNITAGGAYVTITIPVSPDSRVNARYVLRAPAGADDFSTTWIMLSNSIFTGNATTEYVDSESTGGSVVCNINNPDAAFFSSSQYPCIQLYPDGAVSLGYYVDITNGLSFSSVQGSMIDVAPWGVLIDQMTVGLGPGRFSSNAVVGQNALNNNVSGEANTIFGNMAAGGIVSGSDNTVMGFGALLSSMAGHDNTIIGSSAAVYNTQNNNTVIGSYALNNDWYSDSVVAIGQRALESLGNPITAPDFLAELNYIILDPGNTDFVAIGAPNNDVGTWFNPTGPGTGTGTARASTNTNTAIGYHAAYALTNGRHNIYLGAYAGLNHVSGNDCIFIGNDNNAATSIAWNEIVIGYNAVGHGDNTVTLGLLGTTIGTYLYGTVYVNDTPIALAGPVNGTSTLSFGAAPGTNQVELVVTGQTGIAADAAPKVWIGYDSTSDHNSEEHLVLSQFMSVMAGNVVAGTGFTIYAVVPYLRIDGDIKVRWSY